MNSFSANPPPAEETWEQIFNGRDLAGWTPKFTGHPLGVNFKNTFRVEDGLLKVDYREYTRFNGEFGHLFWREKLSHFRIRAEYRFVGEQITGGPSWGFRNNGIMIFSQPPETMELDQEFPASIEVQLLGGGGQGDQSCASFCTPHMRAMFNGKLTTEHRNSGKENILWGDDWNTIEAEVHGSRSITHVLNGERVVTYSQPQLHPDDPYAQRLMARGLPQTLEAGYICIQSETHPTHFRKIEVLELGE